MVVSANGQKWCCLIPTSATSSSHQVQPGHYLFGLAGNVCADEQGWIKWLHPQDFTGNSYRICTDMQQNSLKMTINNLEVSTLLHLKDGMTNLLAVLRTIC